MRCVSSRSSRFVSSTICRGFSGGSNANKNIVRHALSWQHESFYDEQAFEQEMRRVFDVCHGCRRCFNLCDSFPKLFDAVDAAPSEELDTVPTSAFKAVADACTLCDMCAIQKCPYVPPHPYDIDFPHLILRYRAIEQKQRNAVTPEESARAQPVKPHPDAAKVHVEKGVSRELVKRVASLPRRLMVDQDRVAPIATRLAPLVNLASQRKRSLARQALEQVANIDQEADLPSYASKPFMERFETQSKSADANQRKVVLFVTCFVNNNRPEIGESAVRVLRASGVHVEAVHAGCCGMPQLEQGLLKDVASRAERIAPQLEQWLEKGYRIVSLTPSCTLMLQQEWPLLLPNNQSVQRVAKATQELCDYLCVLKKEGALYSPPAATTADQKDAAAAAPEWRVTLHNACHSRAQNVGFRARELLQGLSNVQVSVIERCSGHGGAWGFEKGNFATARRVGQPVVSKAKQDSEAAAKDGKHANHVVVSECPLAADHISSGMSPTARNMHPVQVLENVLFQKV